MTENMCFPSFQPYRRPESDSLVALLLGPLLMAYFSGSADIVKAGFKLVAQLRKLVRQLDQLCGLIGCSLWF